MQKVIIINGITGIGKTRLANEIGMMINGEIIVGDSLQLYKNYKIGSNFYKNDERRVKYHFLGELDVFKNRLNSYEFKQMISKRIEEIISRGKVPIIEGGSVFYTKMLLTNTSDYDQSEEMEAMEINIMKPLRAEYGNDLQKYKNYLRETLINKSWDQDIFEQKNQQKIEKGIIYSLISKGESYLNPQDININESEQLINKYDVRGVFLSASLQQIYEHLNMRCLEMATQPLLQEVQEFYSQFKINNDKTLPIPIGFKQARLMIDQYIQLKIDHLATLNKKQPANKKIYKEQNQLVITFLQTYQDSTRQYCKRQNVFFRSHLNKYLLAVQMQDQDLQNHLSSQLSPILLQQVQGIIEMDQQNYLDLLNNQALQKLPPANIHHKIVKSDVNIPRIYQTNILVQLDYIFKTLHQSQ